MNITLMKKYNADAMVGMDFKFTYEDAYARILKARDALPHGRNEQKIAIFAENSPQWLSPCTGRG